MSGLGITSSVRRQQFANGTGKHTNLHPEVSFSDFMRAATPVKICTDKTKGSLTDAHSTKARRRQKLSQS